MATRYLTEDEAVTFYAYLIKIKEREKFTEDDKLHFRFLRERVQIAARRMAESAGSIRAMS
jgi:hypothetical protein